MDDTLDIELLRHRFQVFETIANSFYGAMLWDLFICLPSEVRYIFWPEFKALIRHGTMPLIPSLLLFLSRILVIPIVSLSRFVNLGQPTHCTTTLRILLVIYAITTANATAVFIIRTKAIRGSRWPLTTFLWFCWACLTAVWFFFATRLTMHQIPKFGPYRPTCQRLDNIPSWTWILFAVMAAFDLLILILTLQSQIKSLEDVKKLFEILLKRKDRNGESVVIQKFFFDSVFYFALSFSITVIEAGWRYTHRQDTFYTAILTPVHIWLCCTIAPRVIRNLKLHNAQTSQSVSARISDRVGNETKLDPFPGKSNISNSNSSPVEPLVGGIPFQTFTTTEVSVCADEYPHDIEAFKNYRNQSHPYSST